MNSAATLSPPASGRLQYRPDIDGLRAVAVLLVLGDHLHTPLTGGYVGVDVFFVISGYLIGAVILSGLGAGTFSLAGFYERRVRRILPALIGMMLGTCVLAYRFDTPSEVRALGPSLLAALLSVSNLFFRHQAGYFDAPSAFKPLLHTWSLGVEEQFYLLFPLLLMGLRRWLPGRTRQAVWTLSAISFAAACLWVRRDPNGAYFLAPLRAWELLLGTIVSQRYVPDITGSAKRNLFSFAGFLMLLIPALLYSPSTSFPGLAALPPCLGAAFIIAAGETGPSVVSSLLSLRPVVFVGLISYSLYLWHWPLIVFQNSANILHLKPGRPGVALILTTVSLIVATLSWRFVETPFRTGRLRPGRRVLMIQTGFAAALVTAIGIAMIVSHGMPGRFPANAQAVAAYMDYSETGPFRENVCFLVGPASTYRDFNPSVCLAPDLHAPRTRNYLLLGDSHAAALYAGLAGTYPEANLYQATAAGCRPLLPAANGSSGDPTCAQLLQFIFGDYLVHQHVDAVLLAGRWQAGDFDRLGATVEWLHDHKITPIVFGPFIEYDAPLPRVLAIALRDGRPEQVKQHRASRPEALDSQMALLASTRWNAAYISMYSDLCTAPDGMEAGGGLSCPVYASSGIPLLFDMDHMTAEGSAFFARAIRVRNQLP